MSHDTAPKHGSAGFGVVGVLIAVAAVGLVAVVGWLVVSAQRSGGDQSDGLVSIPPPAETPTAVQPPANPDGLPRGFTAYSNAEYGFSFAYPQDWGGLAPAADPATLLNLTTNRISGYSLSNALQVSVIKTVNFRQLVNDKAVVVSPSPSGVNYEWKVVDKANDRTAQLGKTYAPAPPVVYRSGKAQVYSFSLTEGACGYTIWAFASGENFVRLRLPSFCVSSKPGDAEVQANHKAEFDTVKARMLETITVL